MILVPVRVGPSPIHGLGLFVSEAVPRGTPVWRFESGFDQEFSPEQVAAFPPSVQAHIRWFGWVNRTHGRWVLSGDHACFMNHAAPPNTGAQVGEDDTVTLEDLPAGTELTCDYWAFDGAAEEKLGKPGKLQAPSSKSQVELAAKTVGA